MGLTAISGPAAAAGVATALVADVAAGLGSTVALPSLGTLATAWGAGGLTAGRLALTAYMGVKTVAVGSVMTAFAGPVLTVAVVSVSPIIIVADQKDSPQCWQDILTSGEVPTSKKALYDKNGMLLPQLVAYCDDFYKAKENGALVVKNKKGEYFAFTISQVAPAGTVKEGPNADYSITVVHVVPVKATEVK